MTVRQRRWLSVLLGTGLLLLLLVVVSVDDIYRVEPPERIALIEVQVYEPPPPPPPAPVDQRDAGAAGPALALVEREKPVVLDVMELDVQLAAAGLGNLGTGSSGFGDGAGVAVLELFGLSELDEVPAVLFAPPMVYPEEAIEQGVDEFEVTIDVVIDEEGRTFPIRVVENPFPSLDGEFADYASQVLFSPPKRLGIPVRTEYLWPLLIRRETDRR